MKTQRERLYLRRLWSAANLTVAWKSASVSASTEYSLMSLEMFHSLNRPVCWKPFGLALSQNSSSVLSSDAAHSSLVRLPPCLGRQLASSSTLLRSRPATEALSSFHGTWLQHGSGGTQRHSGVSEMGAAIAAAATSASGKAAMG